MGHMQLLFPLFWAVLINNRVAVFPWFVVTAAQWGMSDVALRFYMKVLQHTKVISVEAKVGMRQPSVSAQRSILAPHACYSCSYALPLLLLLITPRPTLLLPSPARATSSS